MYKLATIAALLKRVRRKRELVACAMAALFFLSALAAPARAQNTYGGSTMVNGGTIGLVPGQTVSITVPNFYFENGSVKFLKSSVLKVYDREAHVVTERTSGLVYSGESGGLNELGHIFTLSYGDLPVQGEPRTGRKEVWIEVESISFSTTQERTEDLVVLSPTVELIDDADGKTVLLLSLAARPAQAQANADGGLQLEISKSLRSALYGHSSPAAGQTVRILIEAADASTTSLNKPCAPAAHVRAFGGSTGALVWSRELTSLTPGLHTIDINRDELTEAGERGTGRLPLWIEVVIDPCCASEPGAEECGQWVVAPALEVFDNESGKTKVRGGMWGPMKESMETIKKAWKDAS